MANHSDFTIVAQLNGNDTVEGGLTVTDDTLAADPNLAGIYAADDQEGHRCGPGAQDCRQERRCRRAAGQLTNKATHQALELIKNGEMAATVRQDPYGQGKKTVELALTLLDGGTLTFDDPDSRSVFFPVEVVTAENVDQFMQ